MKCKKREVITSESVLAHRIFKFLLQFTFEKSGLSLLSPSHRSILASIPLSLLMLLLLSLILQPFLNIFSYKKTYRFVGIWIFFGFCQFRFYNIFFPVQTKIKKNCDWILSACFFMHLRCVPNCDIPTNGVRWNVLPKCRSQFSFSIYVAIRNWTSAWICAHCAYFTYNYFR